MFFKKFDIKVVMSKQVITRYCSSFEGVSYFSFLVWYIEELLTANVFLIQNILKYMQIYIHDSVIVIILKFQAYILVHHPPPPPSNEKIKNLIQSTLLH